MPPYNPYLNSQQMMNSQNSQEMALQRQIENAQNQLQQMQAQRQMMAQQMATMPTMNQMPTQPMAQPQGIVTQIVESFDNISANAVPMDNNGAIFIKNDGSEIQTRRWTNDGRIQMTSYLPQQAIQNNQTNLSVSEENSKITLSDELTGIFMGRFDDIVARLEKLEQSFTPKSTRNKKEVDAE